MILWKDEYKIGIDLVDSQHERLFELAGIIYDLVKINEDIDKYDQIIEVLQELKDYTVFHFQEEEEYMLKINYPKFLSHKMLHKEFVAKVSSVNITSLDDNQTEYLLEMLTFVLDWLQNHILKVDKQIV